MSLSIAERDAAFVFYSLTFAGTPMPVPLPTVSAGYEQVGAVILAAAIALGARGHMRGADPLTRAEVAEAVEDALSEPGETEPEEAQTPDATLAALEAYAEGRADELAALEKWAPQFPISPDVHAVAFADLRLWIFERRAAGPKRGMTAREVLRKIEERLDRGGILTPILTDLRAEIEGGPHV